MKTRDILRLAAAKPLVNVEATPGELYASGGERWSFKRLYVLGNMVAEKSWATDGKTVWSLAIGRGRKLLFRDAADRMSVSIVRHGGTRFSEMVMILDANAKDAVLHDNTILAVGDLRICVEAGSIADVSPPRERRTMTIAVTSN